MRGATKYQGRVDVVAQFQSTRPMRGATYTDHTFCFVCEFQSTRPMRGATMSFAFTFAEDEEFQSTRPVWGATTYASNRLNSAIVSIHAPRVGRDVFRR